MRMRMASGVGVRSPGSIVGRLCPYVGGFLTIKAFDIKCITSWGISIPVFFFYSNPLFCLSIFVLRSAPGWGGASYFLVDRDPGELLMWVGCRKDACLNHCCT